MRRIRRILYIVILLVLLAVPAQRMDIGRLLPVETIRVSAGEGLVTIRTDTGNTGSGESFAEAYLNMKEQASGDIFLDTANYLILSGTADEWIEELKDCLRPGVMVCRSESEPDLEAVSLYLSVHRPEQRLKDVEKGAKIPMLTQSGNGFKLS